jgi:hypothetical protein
MGTEAKITSANLMPPAQGAGERSQAFRHMHVLDERAFRRRLSLPSNVEMIGNGLGRQPSPLEIRRLAELLETKWGQREERPKTYEHYLKELPSRLDSIPLPVLVMKGKAGWIDSAIHLWRASQLPKDAAEAASNAYWDSYSWDGRQIVLRKITTDTENSSGFSARLMNEGAIPFVRLLREFGEIDSFTAYSWPKKFSEPKVNRNNLSIHLGLGAKIRRDFGNGILEMDYTHLL